MSGSVQAQPTVRSSKRSLCVGGFSAALILVAGVLIVPTTLVMAAASHTAPDTSDYIRMAFAQVAGATVAMPNFPLEEQPRMPGGTEDGAQVQAI